MTNKLFLIAIPLFFVASCNSKKEEEKKETETTKVIAPVSDKIIGIGKIVPEKEIIDLASQINGIVKTILVKENEIFKKGAVLALLNNEVQSSEAKESFSRKAIQNQQIKVAQYSLLEFESKLENTENLYKRAKLLFEKGAETRQVVENYETDYKSLQATVNRLKNQIEVAKSELSSSNSSTVTFEARLNQTKIIAPSDGKILEWKLQPGEGILAQQSIAQIAPSGNTIVECEIDESLATKVKLNQNATINYLGSDEVIAKGTVFFLSDYLKKKSMFSEQSGEAEDRRVRIVKILLENTEGLLFNSKVEVAISNK